MNSQQAKRIEELIKKVGALELDNQQQQNSFVSFTASSSETRTYNVGDHILFDYVLSNHGNSYDNEASTFFCSHNGYYLFSLTVRASEWCNAFFILLTVLQDI